MGYRLTELMMTHAPTCALAILAAASFATGAAAQSPPASMGDLPGATASRPLDGTYRGMYVCQKIGAAGGGAAAGTNVLRAPLDLTIRDGNVLFARPLFNWNATRVVGSEIASGTVDRDGKLHATSAWENGVAFRGDYSGTLTPNGGTFMETQSWRGGRFRGGSRTCTAAVVAVASANPVPTQRLPMNSDQSPDTSDQ
ncbi:MAG: hypothetical protein JOZ01_05420 [Candidatus Eremiobacteraeota bacterium]|nr:hypothetical protein [Candidatus Eremiobacteraeota bacterium]